MREETGGLPWSCPLLWSRALVPLALTFLGCWALTATAGVTELRLNGKGPGDLKLKRVIYSPAPFVVVENWKLDNLGDAGDTAGWAAYLWLPGFRGLLRSKVEWDEGG